MPDLLQWSKTISYVIVDIYLAFIFNSCLQLGYSASAEFSDCSPGVLAAGAVVGIDDNIVYQVQVISVSGPLGQHVDDIGEDFFASSGSVGRDGPDALFVGGETRDLSRVPGLLSVINGPGQVSDVGREGNELKSKIAVAGGNGGRLNGSGSSFSGSGWGREVNATTVVSLKSKRLVTKIRFNIVLF